MSSGIEFLVTPSGAEEGSTEYKWTNTPIGVPEPNPLNNFRVSFRYYEEDEFLTKSYPGFTSVSNVLTAVLPDSDLYTTETGDELFSAPNVAYPLDAYAVAGITDGTAYAYSKVFDQTLFRLIEIGYVPPQAPPAEDGSVKVDVIPLEPYDPDNNLYPYETLNAYNPDSRNFVTVTYNFKVSLTSTFGIPVNDEINITQVVTQTVDDWSASCKYYVGRAAYTNGLYNNEYIKR